MKSICVSCKKQKPYYSKDKCKECYFKDYQKTYRKKYYRTEGYLKNHIFWCFGRLSAEGRKEVLGKLKNSKAMKETDRGCDKRWIWEIY